MIDQVFIPSDHNPGRRLLGIEGVAKLINKAANPINAISRNTVRNWIAAGLIKPPAVPHAGSQPAVFYEGDVIADLKTLVEAVQIVQMHGRDGRSGRTSLADVRAVKDRLEGVSAAVEHQSKSSEQSDTSAKTDTTGASSNGSHHQVFQPKERVLKCGSVLTASSSSFKAESSSRYRSERRGRHSIAISKNCLLDPGGGSGQRFLQKFSLAKPMARKLDRRRWAKNAKTKVGFSLYSQQKESACSTFS